MTGAKQLSLASDKRHRQQEMKRERKKVVVGEIKCKRKGGKVAGIPEG